jgi:hypothetical protein
MASDKGGSFEKHTRKPGPESLQETTDDVDSFAYRNASYPGGLGSKKVDTEAVDAGK